MLAAMKFTSVLFILLALGLAGCNTFEQNLEADNNSAKINTLSEKQNEQVNEFADDGQLNSYEAEQMKEADGAGGVAAPDPGGYLY